MAESIDAYKRESSTWTVLGDQVVAHREGWALEEVSMGAARDLVIVAYGDVFPGDAQALAYVLSGRSDCAVRALRYMEDHGSSVVRQAIDSGRVGPDVRAKMLWGVREGVCARMQGWDIRFRFDACGGAELCVAAGGHFQNDFAVWDHVLNAGTDLARQALSTIRVGAVQDGRRMGEWYRLVSRYQEMLSEVTGMLPSQLDLIVPSQAVEQYMLEGRAPGVVARDLVRVADLGDADRQADRMRA